MKPITFAWPELLWLFALLPLLIVLGVALLLALWVFALWLIHSLGDPAGR